MARYRRAVIVGVGLLGGSIGLALRRRRLVDEVLGISMRGSPMLAAQRMGAIDGIRQTIEEACSEADLAIICTPVQTIAEIAYRCRAAMPPGGLITDVGSTKQSIVEAVVANDGLDSFVGSHPMAGSEKSGVEFAREDLLEGRLVLVTPWSPDPEAKNVANPPDAGNSGQQVEDARVQAWLADRASELWQSLGARVQFLSPIQHDRAVAKISHLPHVLASALAGATPKDLLPLAATGWCDTTRVASGGANLWRQILEENRQPVLAALEEFSQVLSRWVEALRSEEGSQLEGLLEEGKAKRDALGN